jgi:hypothetical protein
MLQGARLSHNKGVLNTRKVAESNPGKESN